MLINCVKKSILNTSFVLFFCLFFGTSFADNPCKDNSCKENSFVIKKDSKKNCAKVSKSKLQEDACTVFADQISCVPDINQSISKIQKILLEHTCKYLESSSDCVILKNDKKKMDEILRVAKNFEEKMEDFDQECKKYLEYLKSLK